MLCYAPPQTDSSHNSLIRISFSVSFHLQLILSFLSFVLPPVFPQPNPTPLLWFVCFGPCVSRPPDLFLVVFWFIFSFVFLFRFDFCCLLFGFWTLDFTLDISSLKLFVFNMPAFVCLHLGPIVNCYNVNQ